MEAQFYFALIIRFEVFDVLSDAVIHRSTKKRCMQFIKSLPESLQSLSRSWCLVPEASDPVGSFGVLGTKLSSVEATTTVDLKIGPHQTRATKMEVRAITQAKPCIAFLIHINMLFCWVANLRE
jgi:hypothetical protein